MQTRRIAAPAGRDHGLNQTKNLYMALAKKTTGDDRNEYSKDGGSNTDLGASKDNIDSRVANCAAFAITVQVSIL